MSDRVMPVAGKVLKVIKQEQIDEIKEILKDAKFSAGGEIFISGDGNFVNRRAEYMINYDVLVKLEKLRNAVSRAHDLISILKA